MSLVNDMLRDLEKRNQKDSVTGPAAPLRAAQTIEDEKRPAASGMRWLLLFIAALALAVTLWVIYSDQFSSSAQTHSVTKPSTPESILATDKNIETTAVQPSPKAPVKLHTILWSGTDEGGDLVVRLDGEADIQLLGQDKTSVTVAFEDVELVADLPEISSALVERIDIFRDKSRTELMLTTKMESQFAFRVQHSPTTMILGVLPQAEPVAALDVTKASVPPLEPQRVSKPVSKTPASAVTKAEPPKVKSAKPIKKTQRIASDKESVIQARKMIQNGQMEAALSLLEKRIGLKPNKSVAARGYLATLQLSAGMRQPAAVLLQESLQLHPNDLLLRKLQSRLWLSEGKASDTLSLLQRQLPEIEKDPEYHELLATAYQQQGNYKQSANVYYALLQYQNNTPRWWVGLAYSLELDKHYDQAQRAYRSAVQIPGITASLKTYAEQRLQALSEG